MMKALLGTLVPELVTMNPGSRASARDTLTVTGGEIARRPVVGRA